MQNNYQASIKTYYEVMYVDNICRCFQDSYEEDNRYQEDNNYGEKILGFNCIEGEYEDENEIVLQNLTDEMKQVVDLQRKEILNEMNGYNYSEAK